MGKWIREVPPPGSHKSGHDQTEHLFNRITRRRAHTALRAFVRTTTATLPHPLLDKRMHVVRKFAPRFSTASVRMIGKAHQYGNPGKHIPGCVPLLMKPGDVTLYWFTEPAGSDAVACLRFDVIVVDHNNFLSERSKRRPTSPGASYFMCPARERSCCNSTVPNLL